jgi:tetratricopeptide (TPR) repeat protein
MPDDPGYESLEPEEFVAEVERRLKSRLGPDAQLVVGSLGPESGSPPAELAAVVSVPGRFGLGNIAYVVALDRLLHLGYHPDQWADYLAGRVEGGPPHGELERDTQRVIGLLDEVQRAASPDDALGIVMRRVPEYDERFLLALDSLIAQAQANVNGERVAFLQTVRGALGAAIRRTWPVSDAVFERGVRLKEQGDLAGAVAAFEMVIGTGHPGQAPVAAFNVGALLEAMGDLDGAIDAYRRAIDFRDPDQGPKAAVNLGNLLYARRDLRDAMLAYQDAIASGHPDQAPMAAVNLGHLLDEVRDFAGARDTYQRAIDSGHADAAPAAAIGLGSLLEAQSDQAGAEAAYRLAMASSHPEHAPMAALGLGNLLRARGDPAGARTAYHRAINSGNAELVARATHNLAVVLHEQGEEVAVWPRDRDVARTPAMEQPRRSWRRPFRRPES